MQISQMEQVVRLNTLSPMVMTKSVVRSMMADGGGRIVNIASVVAFTGYSGLAVLQRLQGFAGRLHPIARPGGGKVGDHRECRCSRFCRYRNDAGA